MYKRQSIPGVAEACALKTSGNTRLVLEKQKGKLSEGNDFTFAIAMDRAAERQGFIEIVGAGPGDPELISVKGKHFLEPVSYTHLDVYKRQVLMLD